MTLNIKKTIFFLWDLCLIFKTMCAFSDTSIASKAYLSYQVIVALIFFFTFFYTKMQINPEKISENLGKSGAYIPSVRPGTETKNYVNKVLSRITVLGSICLALIAVLPHIMPLIWTDMPTSMALGGTGMIIVVGVAIETVRQVQGLITQKSYKKYFEDSVVYGVKV